MDWVLFEEWVREVDRQFSSEQRSVALVIDNCSANPHNKNLKSLKLFFLPSNTTSKTQPMEQGVIRSLKAKYRKNTVQKIIRSLEKNNAVPEVSILKAMQMLAWNTVSTETIVNCCLKARISFANQEAADEDDSFKDFQNEIDTLQNLQPDHVREDVNSTQLY